MQKKLELKLNKKIVKTCIDIIEDKEITKSGCSGHISLPKKHIGRKAIIGILKN